MIDTSVDIIFNSTVWFLVIWVVLAISLNIRDARKRKRLQRARQQAKTKKTVPVEQVIRLAEWNMEQWITEREKESMGWIVKRCRTRRWMHSAHSWLVQHLAEGKPGESRFSPWPPAPWEGPPPEAALLPPEAGP